jgi:hypothetical protein
MDQEEQGKSKGYGNNRVYATCDTLSYDYSGTSKTNFEALQRVHESDLAKARMELRTTQSVFVCVKLLKCGPAVQPSSLLPGI